MDKAYFQKNRWEPTGGTISILPHEDFVKKMFELKNGGFFTVFCEPEDAEEVDKIFSLSLIKMPPFIPVDNIEQVINPKPTVSSALMHHDMTLRDYFAAKAMPAIYRDYWDDVRANRHGGIVPEDWAIRLAMDAYQMANAMMKAKLKAEGDS